MTLTLGRCSGLRPGPEYPKISGDRIDIAGKVVQVANTDILRGIRQQLLGLVGNEDEEIVPCIWASDPTFDGYYRPVAMAVEHIGPTRNRSVRFRATLERLRDYAAPMFEVTVQSALRVNASAITAPAHIVVVSFGQLADSVYLPPSVTAFPLTSSSAATTADSATAQFVRWMRTTFPAVNQYGFSHTPANFYVGSARIELLYGSTWVPVHGRTIPAVEPGQWRITNGLVRFTLGLTYNAAVVMEVWKAGSSAWQAVNFGHFDSANQGVGYNASQIPTRLEILRNSPETVVVRLSGFSMQETFTLDRGDRHVVYTRKRTDAANIVTTHGIKFNANTAATAITGGIRATSNDGNGNRGVLASAQAFTTDLVNGKINLTTAQVAPVTMMFGIELNGSTAIAGDTAADLVGQFMGAKSWRQRVVAP